MLRISVIFIVFFALSAAFAHSVHIDVALKPVGLFEISSTKLFGEIKESISKKGGRRLYADSLSVRVKSLETGIDLRNEHLHQYLNYKKYKRIYLKKLIIRDESGTGNLVINGESKKIKFVIKKENDILKTTFKIKLKDYKLKPKSFMGLSTADEATIRVLVSEKDIIRK